MVTKLNWSAALLPLTIGSVSLLANLTWATVARGQSAASSVPASQNSLVAKKSEQGSVLKLDQLAQPSTKAADLLLNCDNDPLEVRDSKVKPPCQDQNEPIAQSDSSSPGDGGGGILQPTKDRLQIKFADRDPYGFNFGLGSLIGEPSVLRGGTRLKPSPTVEQVLALFPIGGYFEKGYGPSQRTLFEFIGDAQGAVFDLSHTITPKTFPGQLSFNAQTTRSFVGAFTGDNSIGTEVNLPGGADPWVHRSGGGFEFLFPISSPLKIAAGFNYQLVSVRTGAFTVNTSSVDELGNAVTITDDGQDTLTTFNFAALLKAVDNEAFPTKGTKLALGIDASIPTGDAQISYGRFTGSVSQFLPLNLFGFAKGPKTLVLAFQAGTFAGDVPPYEAFAFGGASTVRGYKGGAVGTGKSFILASAEYRFPIASELKIIVDFDLQGALFFDYVNDLNTAGEVIGEPANVRLKPGNGYGYGLALQAKTDFGLIRGDFAFNDAGDFVANFTVGDRY
ncbi:MAG: BamA/TamA family outer membrane protein [Xenococcus sp. MO_188.B8]|nr:BamA/TamA family outer membrane protein [Xenococcus sp. MO_188.B8]